MEITYGTPIGMAIVGLSALMPLVLARMAWARGLSVIPWLIAGIVPLINLLSALALALIPVSRANP